MVSPIGSILSGYPIRVSRVIPVPVNYGTQPHTEPAPPPPRSSRSVNVSALNLARPSARESIEDFEAKVSEFETETIAAALETATGKVLTEQQSEFLYNAVAEDGGENLDDAVFDIAKQLVADTTDSANVDAAADQLLQRIEPEVEARLHQHEGLFHELDRRILGSEITEATGLELPNEQLDRLLDVLDHVENEHQAATVFEQLLGNAVSQTPRYNRSSAFTN